ncbi:MAG: hypothetical protein MI739_14635 [Bacteroidales bacterium]|nr:hypothetical protein [Bacteroidales bacterium]
MKHYNQLVEEYLDGTLSINEQIKFNEHLKNDQELRKEFRLRKEINRAILENDILNLRESLQEIIDTPKERTIFQNPFVISSFAASIIILIVFTWSIFFSSNITPEDIYINHYYKYPVITYNRTVSDNLNNTNLDKAFLNYETENYNKSKNFLNLVLNDNRQNAMAKFYLASCEMELNNIQAAQEIFLELIQNSNHIFWEQAYWYLALIYIKKDDIDNASLILNKIIKGNMCKKKEAESIIKMLD